MSALKGIPDSRRTSSGVRKAPTGDIAWREATLSLLEHVHGETIGIDLAIHVGPKAIHLIALNAFNGHQWSSRAQPNKVATPERRSGLVLRV
jgi:hypothetical protein